MNNLLTIPSGEHKNIEEVKVEEEKDDVKDVKKNDTKFLCIKEYDADHDNGKHKISKQPQI